MTQISVKTNRQHWGKENQFAVIGKESQSHNRLGLEMKPLIKTGSIHAINDRVKFN